VRLLAAGLVIALALAFPVAAPVLVEFLAPTLGPFLGLSALSVEIDRLGWRRVTVRRIAFVSGRVAVQTGSGEIEYRVPELLRGRARLVAFDRVALTVNPASPEAGGGAVTPPLPLDGAARWRDVLPFERAEVRELAVTVPAVGFAGSGGLRVDADALELALAGEAPAAAAGIQLALRVDPSGSMALDLSERSRSTQGAAPLLRIALTPSGTGLDVAGDVRLQGYAWDLAASLLDLPVGAGALDGQLRAHLPWTDSGGPQLAALKGEGRIRSLQWTAASGSPALTLDDGRVDLDGRALSGTLSGVVRMADMAIPLATRLRMPDLAAEPLAVSGEIRRGALEGLSWSVVVDPATAMPRLGLEGELRIATPFMKTLLERWRGVWDLDSGSLALAAHFHWPELPASPPPPPAGAVPAPQEGSPDALPTAVATEVPWPEGKISLSLRDASAHYDDYKVGGLTGTLAVELDGTAWRLAPSELRARTVSAGVELGELRLGFSGSSAALAFREIAAQAFGGALSVAPFAYDLEGQSGELVVEFAGVDLARLLALYGERIAGSGVLDGTLPVTLAGAAISIRNGTVAARAPGGFIRLAPELTRATGQPGLDFALAALADFAYTRLSADVDYAPTGELTLGVALQGRNPAVEGGRPIHYNLNVTENVPQLLESLTLHERLVRDIERRVTE
jgi:hypothetical protein